MAPILNDGIEATAPNGSPVALASGYVTGDCIGALWMLPNFVSGLLSDVTIIDATNTKIAIDIVFFRGTPAAQTDSSPPTLSLTSAKALAIISIPASQWVTVGSEAIATVSNLALFRASGAAGLYFILIARGSLSAVTGQITVIGGVAKG